MRFKRTKATILLCTLLISLFSAVLPVYGDDEPSFLDRYEFNFSPVIEINQSGINKIDTLSVNRINDPYAIGKLVISATSTDIDEYGNFVFKNDSADSNIKYVFTNEGANCNGIYSVVDSPTVIGELENIPSVDVYIDVNADDYNNAAAGTYESHITWIVDLEDYCVLAGTDITLVDGTTKKVEDLTMDDCLKTFNFWDGSTASRDILYIIKHENTPAFVMTMTLDNGKTLDFCDVQSFFDMDLLYYFDISASNYRNCIGKNILYLDGDTPVSAKIVNITAKAKYCDSYELLTYDDFNFIANNILTIEPLTWFYGMYTIKPDLSIDMDKYLEDVAAYGQYTYDDWSDYMSETFFNLGIYKDIKIAVGKGYVTKEYIVYLLTGYVDDVHDARKSN